MISPKEQTSFRAVSVGAIVKKILKINSELEVQRILAIIQESRVPDIEPGQSRFDEEKALILARKTL